jgi:hypothetical protein
MSLHVWLFALVKNCHAVHFVPSNFPFILAHHFHPMQLVMYLGNDYIASVSIDTQQLSVPGYLGALKRQMKQDYNTLLQGTTERPEFLVVHQFLAEKEID